MIEVKVKNGDVTVQAKGPLGELVNETAIIMSSIFDSIQRQDPESADLFKDIVEFAFERDMVWNICNGGNGK